MKRRPWHAHYDEGVPIDFEWEPVPLPAYLQRAAERFPDRPAIAFMNAELSFAEFHEEVRRFATALASLGVKKGDRVAIHLPNLPQTAIAIMATLSLGACCVMTNPLYVEREIEHQWNDAGVKLAVTADFLYESRIKAIRDKLPAKRYVIASIPEYLRFPLNVFAHFKLKRMDPPSVASVKDEDGIEFFRPLVKATDPDPPEVSIRGEDLAFVQYTGGTTGVSKGAMLTHASLSANIQQLLAWYPDLEPGTEVALSALPFFHVFGLVATMLVPVASAATMVIVANPRDTHTLVRAIVRNKVTVMAAVPPLYAAIARHKGIQGANLDHVKICISGAAPLPSEVADRFEQLTGCRIVEAFGMTELSLASHANPQRGEKRRGSIGLPLPGTDARIADPEDDGRDLPPGEVGELVIQGPQVMAGYWNRPEETRDALRGGWLHTGDLARMDEDGYFYIAGRKKDMIKTSGYCVYPDEIDEVLHSHPGVAECASIGVPDAIKGEVIKSFVVMKPGAEFDPEELKAFCRERLAPYKVPRKFEQLDALPRSGVMKILRRELRKRELGKMSAAG